MEPSQAQSVKLLRMKRGDVIASREQIVFEKPFWLQERLRWFRSLKFGVIFHWGPYAQWDCCESWPLVPEDEWARADDMECWTARGKNLERFQEDYWRLNESFNPVRFDPQRWADIIAQSGARYMTLTAKHHDGFCLWDTTTTTYRSTHPSCPFHRHSRCDIVREVFDSFRNRGLAISCYFSKADWSCPYYWSPSIQATSRHANTVDDPETWAKFVDFTYEQIAELMSDYGKIDILWLDAGWVKGREDIEMDQLIGMARALQPHLIVANRTVGDQYEDFLTPERGIPDDMLSDPWEACIPLGDNWKFHPRDKFKSAEEVVETLQVTASRGGNLLLGIGPDANGEIPEEPVEVLTKVGEWISKHGDKVFG